MAYTLAGAPDCRLSPEGPSAIASGGSLDYICTNRVALTGTSVVPANIAVKWNVRTSIEGGWSVQLLPPSNTSDEIVEWTPEGMGEARFAFDQAAPAGVSVMPGAIDTSAEVTFRLRIHRATCALEQQTVQITHDVTVQTPDAAVEPDPVQSEPRRVTPDLLAMPEPVVAFNGPLDFGEVGVTASGADDAVKSGTLSLTVTGLDEACGTWNVQASATALTDQSGSAMAGSRLVVVSIDDESIPDGGCDLAGGCGLVSLAGGPDAQSTRTITLGVELHMPQQPGPGSFTTSIDALLIPAANS